MCGVDSCIFDKRDQQKRPIHSAHLKKNRAGKFTTVEFGLLLLSTPEFVRAPREMQYWRAEALALALALLCCSDGGGPPCTHPTALPPAARRHFVTLSALRGGQGLSAQVRVGAWARARACLCVRGCGYVTVRAWA